MTLTISVPFEEHEDSPIERGNSDSGFEFSRIFLVPYEQRFVFLTEMFTGGIDGRPKAYHTLFPNLLCNAFDIERMENKPFGPNVITDPERQIIGHDTLAKIKIEYKPAVYNNDIQIQKGTIATYNQAQSIEVLEIPGRGGQWESGKKVPADVKYSIPIATTRHEVTWSQVSNVPWGLLSTLKGHVNSNTFHIPAVSLSLPPGTLLFLESSSQQTLRYDGSLSTDLTLVFLEKRQYAFGGEGQGWNYMFNPDTRSYEPVSASGATTYPSADLGAIFR